MSKHKNAILLLIVSNICFGVLPVLVKVANSYHYSAMEETFFRFSISLLGVFLLWSLGWQKLRVVNKSWIFWRGLLGAVSVTAYFVALQTTSAAVGTLLNYTYILWANVFMVVLLRHKPPKGFYFCLALAVVGVDLVLGARLDHVGLGEMAGLFSGVTGGIAVMAIKKSRDTDTALSVFASFAVFSFFLAGAVLLWGNAWGIPADLTAWSQPTLEGGAVLIALGIVSMTAQVLFTEALGRTSLALGSFLTLSVPVLASFFGWLFLGETLTPHFTLGLLLVLSACGIMVWRENKA